jgi:transcriptional regulator with XRE-family HTH domain
LASSLGQKIRTLRKDKGMTLENLAAATESSKSYIWELENKENARPSAEKMEKIAAALDVTAQYLIDETMDSPTVSVSDEAFFRKYRALDAPTKEKLEQILKVLDSE